MKRSRFREEQIIGFIKEVDAGTKVDTLCRREGFSPATFYASRYDGYELENLIDPDNTASNIWADTAYGSKANQKMLEKRGLRADIHTRKPK